jgi:CheY-like chemotaxis protein
MSDAVLADVRNHFDSAVTIAVYEESCVGVGLSLVAGLVRLLKGQITLDSKLGQGTTVTVSFPYTPQKCPAKITPTTPPRKIVCYSVDGINCDLIKQFAAWYGFAVTFFDRIETALQSKDLNLLLLDFQLGQPELPLLQESLAKGGFKGVNIACLGTTKPPEFDRPVEWFVKPLRLDLFASYLVKVTQGLEPVTPVAKAPQRKLHILGADDNQMNQLVLKKILERADYTFVIVSNGEEAVNAVVQEQFDLILMDHFMPTLSGPEAARRIRQLDPPVCNIPIIAMTASGLQSDEQECISSGMNEYICKPVTVAKLKEVIQKVCFPHED